MAKFVILVITTLALLGGLAANIWAKEAPFNYNLKIVPEMQNNSFLSSSPFIIVMNIVSNLFNPILCAGYILALYVLSHRKMQILVFLLWFIFMSVGLSFLKTLFHQARPYWMQGSGVKMLEWTCYTQYGCPSGHSMLGLVLIQFLIRFFTKTRQLSQPKIWLILGLGFTIQLVVLYSRMILGMHSLNQVLFGLMLGFASMVYYYGCAEVAILKLCLLVTRKFYKKYVVILTTNLMFLSLVLMLLALYWPKYDNSPYIETINSFSGCKGFHGYASFQYKCFIDMSLLMAGFGIVYGLTFVKNPQNLLMQTVYSRKTKSFLKRLLLTIVTALIPVIIFLNPLWKQIKMEDEKKALFLCFMQSCGLLLATFFMITFAPALCARFGLQKYARGEKRNESEYKMEQNLRTLAINEKQRESAQK